MAKMSIVRYQTREYVGVHSRMLLWLFQVTFGYSMHQQRRRKHQQHDRSPSYAQHTHVEWERDAYGNMCNQRFFSGVSLVPPPSFTTKINHIHQWKREKVLYVGTTVVYTFAWNANATKHIRLTLPNVVIGPSIRREHQWCFSSSPKHSLLFLPLSLSLDIIIIGVDAFDFISSVTHLTLGDSMHTK